MNDRLVVGALDTANCPVYVPMASFFESSDAQDIQSEVQRVPGFDAGLEQLSNGHVDILAIPATILHGRVSEIAQSGCEVIGARTPRRPNLVLVSGDRLYYQPKSAIIVADSDLVRRQLLRARSDLAVMAPEESPLEDPAASAPDEAIERARWLGEL